MTNDTVGDMLIRIKNAYMARRDAVEIPASKFNEKMLQLLNKLGYLGSISAQRDKYKVTLRYIEGMPAMTDVKRISRPGLRRYTGVYDLGLLRREIGHVIISSPQGLITHGEALKKRTGGELICKVW